MSAFAPRPNHFLWRQEGRVGVITLNRPERKNPLTFESYAELRDLFRALREADAADADVAGADAPAGDSAVGVPAAGAPVRAIVLYGAGGNFCSGGDVHEIIAPLTERGAAGLLEFTRMTGDLVKAMRHCPQPIVAAVDGVCAGAGAILAMASDFRLGTPRAKTAFLFTRVGLAGCDMGACAILPRIIGHGRASELLFTGRSMSADEAVAWGFFNRLVSPEEVLEESLRLAQEMAAGPTLAHAMTKKMLHVEWNMPIDAAIDADAEAQAICMQTEDFRRAYRAFAAKRKPQFQGN
jgi:enoyl-CoA hydratase/carnithine racemase